MPDSLPEPMLRQGRSVRAHLTVFALVLALPIVGFAGFLFWRVAVYERDRLEADAAERARSVALSIDRELTGLFASLDVLSLSAHLQTGSLESFYKQATELAVRQGIVPVLSDPSGQQLVNLRVPWGTALPKSNLPVDDATLARGRPFVTDAFDGAMSGRPAFAVATSVLRDGKPAYILSFSLEPDRLQRILAEAEIPGNWTASIVDRKGIVLARTPRPEEYVGKLATQDLRDQTGGREGTWLGSTLEGLPIFGAYARSRLSDFRAVMGVRDSDLNAPLWEYLSLFAALGLVIVCFSAVLGFYFGKRITDPMMALAERASVLGRGEPVTPLETDLREVNQVGAELAMAFESLREREADLREANEESQRFAYIVSHDLRSPLVNIMGFTTELEALRQDVFARLHAARQGVPHGRIPALAGPAPAGQAAGEEARDEELGQDFDEAIGFIKTSIAKMDRLINAILRLSREGRREFKPERVDMEALALSIRDSLAHQATAAEAEVIVGKLPDAVSDRLALEQIFSNLVDNALKYLRRGVPGRVEIEGRATAGGLVYEVRDNGRGIDPKDRERVFDLFRRSGVQDRPGEGIGLAHVRALARRLGGTITLTSEPGQGSTFTITLPRRWRGEGKRKAA
jgi:signal transduction histidine kinase